MKKSIIAASASAVALAAMPILGVFAATGETFTDTLQVNVPSGCTIEDADATASTNPPIGTYTDTTFDEVTIQAGTVGYINGNATGATGSARNGYKVSCNTSAQAGTKHWSVSVKGSNLADTNSHTIAPGDAVEGNTSAWAIQSNQEGHDVDTYATGFSDPFAEYKGVTAAGTAETFLEADINDSTVEFNPSYRVYVAPGQAVGHYTGTAEYTVTLPN